RNSVHHLRPHRTVPHRLRTGASVVGSIPLVEEDGLARREHIGMRSEDHGEQLGSAPSGPEDEDGVALRATARRWSRPLAPRHALHPCRLTWGAMAPGGEGGPAGWGSPPARPPRSPRTFGGSL